MPPTTNKRYMTPDGRVYEAPYPLSPDHQLVELQQEFGQQPAPIRVPHQPEVQEDEEVQRSMNVNPQAGQRMHQQPPYGGYPPIPPMQPAPHQPVPGVDAPYTINQDSQFNFKLKDVLIIAGAIASAAVSWNNADGRISRLEEKVSQDMVERIKTVEKKQDDLVRKQEESMKALTSQISDLERAITTLGRK